MPQRFYQHICKEKNFLYLNGKNVLQPQVSEIINDFLSEGEENYKDLRNILSRYKNICLFRRFRRNLLFKRKEMFQSHIFKAYKDKKKNGSLSRKKPS